MPNRLCQAIECFWSGKKKWTEKKRWNIEGKEDIRKDSRLSNNRKADICLNMLWMKWFKTFWKTFFFPLFIYHFSNEKGSLQTHI